jgi:cyclophilin family peptidyl-prolyl cis-trans isomerase/HEAT repeat protein
VALLRIKEPSSVGAIAGQLGSPDPEMRWQAANALARIRDGIAIAVPALLPLLEDKDWMVRANAARALGAANDNRAVLPLVNLLNDPDRRVAVNAINALGTVGDARGVEPLINLGNREVSGYRAFNREKEGVPAQQNSLLLIATALGNIKDVRGVAFLKSLRFIDGRVGWAPEVEIAIAKFGEGTFFDIPEGMTLPKDDWKATSAYAQGLGQIGTDRAREVLLDLRSGKTYGKPDPRAVPDILSALAAAKASGLREMLVESLKSEDVIVRATAATLLGEQGEATAAVLTALQQAYAAAKSDKMNDARIAILEASEKLKHPLSVQVLQENTRDSDYVVRLRAAELLRQSAAEIGTLKLQVGKAETTHDRAYWRRMAAMVAFQKNPVAVLHTKKGAIRIELFAGDAPMTVDNFMQLAKSGFYNGLSFMRVVPNFVIQGGDPRNDTNGGPGYQIRDEINMRPYQTGTVGMALSGKDTGGSQFFITHSPQPHLDGGYTVFGQVIEGMDTVNRIARDDRIEHVEIIEGQ